MSDRESIKAVAFIAYQNFILINKTCQLIGSVVYFVPQIAYKLSESGWPHNVITLGKIKLITLTNLGQQDLFVFWPQLWPKLKYFFPFWDL